LPKVTSSLSNERSSGFNISIHKSFFDFKANANKYWATDSTIQTRTKRI
jgi:hypothetical protein